MGGYGLRIGVSSSFMHRDPERALFKGKTLQFIEEKMALAVHRAGAIPFGIPDLKDPRGAEAIVRSLDGLVLSGGADVSPSSYGEAALDPNWEGDAIRDAYEQTLIDVAVERNIPVLGICRGIQMLNVARGGTLYQDIETQVEGSLTHRDWHRYEIIEHDVELAAGSWIRGVYGSEHVLVNTVHHQAIKDLASGLEVTARAPDGIVEAVEQRDDDHWLVGIQWHPEWLDGSEEGGSHRSRGDDVFEAFVAVCEERRA